MSRLLVIALSVVLSDPIIGLWAIEWSAGLGCALVGVPIMVMTWRVS